MGYKRQESFTYRMTADELYELMRDYEDELEWDHIWDGFESIQEKAERENKPVGIRWDWSSDRLYISCDGRK
jgi:hypothetical protein